MNDTTVRDPSITAQPVVIDYSMFLQPEQLCPMQKSNLVQSVARLLRR